MGIGFGGFGGLDGGGGLGGDVFRVLEVFRVHKVFDAEVAAAVVQTIRGICVLAVAVTVVATDTENIL